MKFFVPLVILSCLLGSTSAFGQELGLASQIEALDLATSEEGVEHAILVQNAKTGEVVYAKNPDALLNPASNSKVLTTLAALSFLSPEFRFKTQLLCEKKPKGDHLEVLTLKGFGDPSFSSYNLENMVLKLKAQGLHSVAELRIDEGYFDNRYFPGREDGFGQRLFELNALTLDNNKMEVVVTPGEAEGEKALVNLDPPLDAFSCEGEVLTGRGPRLSVQQHEDGSNSLGISVAGAIPLGAAPRSYRLNCEEPGKLAAYRLLDLLKRHGISAPSQFRLASAPAGGKVLVEEKSTTLSELLPVINKKSDNFLAELLAKILGAEYGGQPGSTEKGVRAIMRELNATGVDVKGIFLENGSGLSRNTRVKVKTLVSALQKVYDNPRLRNDFIASLSILGVDGTLRRRFANTELAGRFVGKTGTLRGVSALSGFAYPASGAGEKTYIYSHLINGSGKGFGQQRQLMRQILELLLNQ